MLRGLLKGKLETAAGQAGAMLPLLHQRGTTHSRKLCRTIANYSDRLMTAKVCLPNPALPKKDPFSERKSSSFVLITSTGLLRFFLQLQKECSGTHVLKLPSNAFGRASSSAIWTQRTLDLWIFRWLREGRALRMGQFSFLDVISSKLQTRTCRPQPPGLSSDIWSSTCNRKIPLMQEVANVIGSILSFWHGISPYCQN